MTDPDDFNYARQQLDRIRADSPDSLYHLKIDGPDESTKWLTISPATFEKVAGVLTEAEADEL